MKTTRLQDEAEFPHSPHAQTAVHEAQRTETSHNSVKMTKRAAPQRNAEEEHGSGEVKALVMERRRKGKKEFGKI